MIDKLKTEKFKVHIIQPAPQNLIMECEFKRDDVLSLLQKLVDGYIEVVPGRYTYNGKKYMMIVDEEGKLKVGAKLNEIASELTGNQHIIVGNAVLIEEKDFE